jgi:ABC-type bacteriocin/lantibiotic exporter with double-glycine peptidase domain
VSVVLLVVCCINPWLFIFSVLGVIYSTCIINGGSKPVTLTQDFLKDNQPNLNSSVETLCLHLIEMRTYRRLDQFKQEFQDAVDKSANSIFTHQVAVRWISYRLDSVIALFGAATVGLTLAAARAGYLETVGLVFQVIVILDLYQFFSISIRMYGEIRNLHPFVRRIMELHAQTLIEPEDELNKDSDKQLTEGWPTQGEVCFYDVSCKQSPDNEMLDL